MISGPLFKWFGSKWQAAAHYPAPEHRTIFEPFAGSAGYSLRHANRHVVLWESNRQLRELWTWLISEATKLEILGIPTELPQGFDIRKLGLGRGQALLLKHWQRTNNVGDCWTISPWGNLPGQWTSNTRARVSEEYRAVRHWEIRPISFNEKGTYFIDPPYRYNYRYRSASPFDYDRLVQQIWNLPPNSQTIACEAVCPKTGALPDYLPFQQFRKTVTSRRKEENHHHSEELIYHEKSGD